MYSVKFSFSPDSWPVLVTDARPTRDESILNAVREDFPSPAADHGNAHVDLNSIRIKHSLATCLMWVRCASMPQAGIDDCDVVPVDRAVKPCHGHVVAAVVDAEFTLKKRREPSANLKLLAANPTYPDILHRAVRP
jgi:DNA polymerase V